ncbi:MAG: LysR family transcriptional regulator [Acidocella sp.]|nr:LysR family transcriptional regulator [Acidocella sp.]
MKQDLKNVTLKQLRVLAAVVRSGSVTAAANQLNVSPPAVTLQMQLLQDHAGLPLVERSGSLTKATDAGGEILRAIEQIETILANCNAALAAIAGTKQGSVSVGVISTAKYFVPRLLGAFMRSHPGIDLKITIGNREEMLEGLQSYKLDLAVMGRPPVELDVESTAIGDNPHVIIAPVDHELAKTKLIKPSRLAEEIFIVREPGSGTRMLMERFFAEAGISPRIRMQIGSNESIKQAVIAGLGISFISGHTLETALANKSIVVLPVEGLPIIRQWCIVHLRQRHPMPAVTSIRNFFVSECHNYLPDISASVPLLVQTG